MKKYLIILLSTSLFTTFSQDFITRDGHNLTYKDSVIMLRGMAFGNLVWDDNFSPTQHHNENDYRRLNELGMNAIRFYLNYKTFESDDEPYTYLQSGWDWIDQNIEWAKKHGIFLILNMHVPQGGFQSRCEGDALWTNPDNQARLSALWKEIALQYKDEPQIAGFDILNEPTPSTTVAKWDTLAQRIIDSIRTVDNNHLIITERAIALDCDYAYANENNNYPQINEQNLMYTVHMYDPHYYTHQNLEWAGTGDGGSYPDEDQFTLPADLEYYTGDYNNPSIARGTTDWTLVEGSPYLVNDTSILIGRVVYTARAIDTGTVYFDDYMLLELNAQNEVVDTIFNENPTNGNYWWWSEDNTGDYEEVNTGYNDNYAVAVTGNTKAISIVLSETAFRAKQGMKYKVVGHIKGESIPVDAHATISCDFYHSPSGQKLSSFNYDYLVERITSYAEYIENKGFPVYFGEFGVARNAFENNKGGERWVADVLKIYDSLGYHFTYHSYKESSFGYYDGWEKPVDTTTVNTALQEVFLSFFGKKSTTGLGETINKNVILFPNPAEHSITISTTDNSTIDLISCYDQYGKLLFTSRKNTIAIEQLVTGSYYLQVVSNTGTAIVQFAKE